MQINFAEQCLVASSLLVYYTICDWTTRGVKEAIEIRKTEVMPWTGMVVPPTTIVVHTVAGEEGIAACHKWHSTSALMMLIDIISYDIYGT